MTAPIPTVHVVDDDDSLRTAVLRLLKAAGFQAQGYASAGAFLCARVKPAPGCLILDVCMPGPSGFDLQAAFADHEEALPIIFLTGNGDIPMSVRAMRAGAVDFLTKPVLRTPLLNAVARALALDAKNREGRRHVHDLHARYESLTPREKLVFESVVGSKANKQIARELGISERTVKTHRAKVMEKLNVASLPELTRFAEVLRNAAVTGERTSVSGR